MERIHKIQLWKRIGGDVLEKGAELAETYDMTSQPKGSHTKKRTFPIKKTAGLVSTSAGPAQPPEVLGPVPGVASSSLPQMTGMAPHVDVTSKSAPRVAQEKKAHYYAMPSQQRYPLDNYLQVKQASRYFEDTYKFMPPEDRHEYCQHLVKRAHALGLRVSELAEKYGSATYASTPDIEVCLEARRSNIIDDVHKSVLDKLASCRSAMLPEDFALTLQEFDKAAQLAQHYGNIPDAYYTTFGKKASEGTEEDPEGSIILGNEYITRRRLAEFVKNNVESLKLRFGIDVAEGLRDDTNAIFNSLPRDQKLVIMRMANNDDRPVQQGIPTA